MCKVIGIDISKETFDASFCDVNGHWQHGKYANTAEGFGSFGNILSCGDHVVMEASGPYYLPLAYYFYGKGMCISVVNPLVIKRYAQMRFYRAKTDKKDAQTIAEFGANQHPGLWHPENATMVKMRQLYTSVELLGKQIHQSRRELEAFASSGQLDRQLEKEMKLTIAFLEKQKLLQEEWLSKLGDDSYGEELKRVESIPGIGSKTARLLCIISNGFTKFTHYKQLIAYVGFSPRIVQSGTSVKGKGHICKMGTGFVRKLLYMCTWSAKRVNKGCKEMYERLKAKGKPERVIKIAIANKLLKQVFAIAKNKINFNNDYVPNVCF